jgi:hypothetical protein
MCSRLLCDGTYLFVQFAAHAATCFPCVPCGAFKPLFSSRLQNRYVIAAYNVAAWVAVAHARQVVAAAAREWSEAAARAQAVCVPIATQAQ